MRLPCPLGVLAAAWLVYQTPGAAAQSVVIAQSVEQTQTIDLAAVQALPQVDTHMSMLTGHGTVQATYRGALLWAVLEKVGLVSGDPRSHVRRVVMVTGRDGYTAALALGEIDPEFEGKQVIVADQQDGQALKGGELRLVVPGDKRGGRSVRDIVRIELR
ncbi:MAG TPA: molybdopterin-dependent oxidoreductase [Acetobacteraceae bacterium]|jgi:DMSO/TMAO reductase YedYZ molybdopterin-dependent catalytic subunit|nr:molybdopterin-dependent oxidoreductase [Acetobacteraceae bacterium]